MTPVLTRPLHGRHRPNTGCLVSGCCLSAREKQSETLQGSPTFQPLTGGEDLEHALETGTFAVGRGWREPPSPGGATGEEIDPGNAAEMGEGCVLPEALKPRVSRPFHTFVSPSVIK